MTDSKILDVGFVFVLCLKGTDGFHHIRESFRQNEKNICVMKVSTGINWLKLRV